MSMTAAREAVLLQTADALLTARRTHTPIADLPPALAPASEAEAFAVQDMVAQAYGAIGGWKIGAAGAAGEPFFAPMPASWMGENGSLFRGINHRLFGIEAEIAFQIGQDLPPSSLPYTREEVTAAISSCAPAIEILESAYIDPQAVSRPNMLADLQMHGGFVAGPAVPRWQEIDWAKETIVLTVDGAIRYENTGTAPAGPDLVRLLLYLANEGAARTGGLKRGNWITTGSWSGLNWARPGAEAVAHFGRAGRANLLFAPVKP
ncbi:MAG: 2-keto-4-pentenoate hydratase [Janthinobacterium lividum]